MDMAPTAAAVVITMPEMNTPDIRSTIECPTQTLSLRLIVWCKVRRCDQTGRFARTQHAHRLQPMRPGIALLIRAVYQLLWLSPVEADAK